VGEPGQELFDGHAGPQFPDSRAKVFLGVDGKVAQLALEVRPPQFDGIQVQAVGRQVAGDGRASYFLHPRALLDVARLRRADLRASEFRRAAYSNDAQCPVAMCDGRFRTRASLVAENELLRLRLLGVGGDHSGALGLEAAGDGPRRAGLRPAPARRAHGTFAGAAATCGRLGLHNGAGVPRCGYTGAPRQSFTMGADPENKNYSRVLGAGKGI
jgi:hypothetical protein